MSTWNRPSRKAERPLVALAAGLVIAGASGPVDADQRPAKNNKTFLITESSGVRFLAQFSDWCVMLGLQNKNGYKVRVEFEYDVVSNKGARHHEKRDWVELKPGERKGGAHFFTDDIALEACPWVGEKQKPARIENFRFKVRNLTAEEQKKEEEKRRAEEERRLEEERRRKEEEARLAEEKRLEEERRKEEEERERAEAERRREEEAERKREEEKRREGARNGGAGRADWGGGGGVATAADRKAQREAEKRRQVQAYQGQVREADRRMAEQRDAHAQLATGLAAGGDTSVAPEGTSSQFGVYIGSGALFFPVLIDSSGGGVMPYSSSRASGGLALTAGLDYFPRFGSKWGAGLSLFSSAGSAPMPGGSLFGLEASATLKGYAGSDSGWALLGEVGYLGRMGGWNVNDAFGTSTEGSGRYSAVRLGTGVRRCLSSEWGPSGRRGAKTERDARERFCKRGVDLRLGLDLPSIEDAGAVPVFGLSAWWRGFLRVGVTAAPGYPAAGTASFPLDGERSGWMAVFQAERGWEFYSAYRTTGRGSDATARGAPPEADGEEVADGAPAGQPDGAGAAIDPAEERSCRGPFVNATECVRVAGRYLKSGGARARRAPALLEIACRSEVPAGCRTLGLLYFRGELVPKDEGKAQQLFERACNEEPSAGAACYAAGWAYQFGRPIQSDLRARSLYEVGCVLDEARACLALGIMDREGLGGPRSPYLARGHFERGCLLGNAVACDALARLHDGGSLGSADPASAAIYYKEGCGRGLGASCRALGRMHAEGRGVPADAARAAEYQRRACTAAQPDRSCGRPAEDGAAASGGAP